MRCGPPILMHSQTLSNMQVIQPTYALPVAGRRSLPCRSCFTTGSLPMRTRPCTGRLARTSLVVKADSADNDEARQEALLERREKAARRNRDSSSYRQLQAQQQASRQAAMTGKPRWPEGQLFPDGWEEMGFFGKAWQLYAGDRGILFWANKLAFTAIFAIIGGWILFRFVGPATGLYQLTNDISTPSKF